MDRGLYVRAAYRFGVNGENMWLKCTRTHNARTDDKRSALGDDRAGCRGESGAEGLRRDEVAQIKRRCGLESSPAKSDRIRKTADSFV